MSVTRFSPQPSPLPYSGHALKLPLYAPKKSTRGRGGRGEVRPKKSEFCWPSSFFLLSRFFIYFYCVTRLKCALQIFMPANCLKREQNMFICHTHTHPHTHSRANTHPHTHANFQLICLHSSFSLFLCILFRTRIKVCCSRIIHATKELALCHASPRLRLCVTYICVCVCVR